MKIFKLLIVLFVIAMLLPTVGLAAISPTSTGFVSEWIIVKSDNCGTAEHGLGYIPYHVNAWVNLNMRTQTYADVANYEGIELYTSPTFLTICNYTGETIEVKMAGQ